MKFNFTKKKRKINEWSLIRELHFIMMKFAKLFKIIKRILQNSRNFISDKELKRNHLFWKKERKKNRNFSVSETFTFPIHSRNNTNNNNINEIKEQIIQFPVSRILFANKIYDRFPIYLSGNMLKIFHC